MAVRTDEDEPRPGGSPGAEDAQAPARPSGCARTPRATLAAAWAALVRAPVVQFLTIGAVLLAIDRVRHPPGEGDAVEPPLPPSGARMSADGDAFAQRGPIEIDEGSIGELRRSYTQTRGEPPDDRTLEALIDEWYDTEVLFVEGLRLGLDVDDPKIRLRIADKMRFVLASQADVDDLDPEALRAAFDRDPSRYARETSIDFIHVFVAGDDDAAHERAAALLERLAAGEAPAGLGDVFSGGRRYRRRTLAQLEASFGTEFAEGFESAPLSTWQLRRSRHGWHVVAIERRTPASAPGFEEVREDVLYDERARLTDAHVANALDGLRTRHGVPRRRAHAEGEP